MNRELSDKVASRLERIPRCRAGLNPTPLEEMVQLRETLGKDCPRLLIKRDDYTGLGFGGNKVRKLAYVLARAVDERAEAIITIGGEKSNHARVTASTRSPFATSSPRLARKRKSRWMP